ncbi:MAG: lipoyl synthase [Enterobacterales bacterium]
MKLCDFNLNINSTKCNNKNYIPIINISNKKNEENILSKPSWIKVKIPVDSDKIKLIKHILRKNNLHSVCEEASCPNLSECFNRGTATFMILGSICTRNCPFCDVKHGRPVKPDVNEPHKLATAIQDMKLKYVVITSVDRDDLKDGGAQHFVDCINSIRMQNNNIIIEILVPDFRGCTDKALNIINTIPPNIFNHNLENVPRLYKKIRPGANYKRSLNLLKKFKRCNKTIPTKSGLMVGLGETNDEIINVMYDLRSNDVTMITIGQYLQPSKKHLPVKRYVCPQEFKFLKEEAIKIGFTHAECGPFVRSSYHADYYFNFSKK